MIDSNNSSQDYFLMWMNSYSNYLDLSVITIAFWLPHTLFPVGLWYYTCLTCFDAFSFLSFVSFSSLISHNASLSFHSHSSSSQLSFHSHSFHSHNASLSFYSHSSLLSFYSQKSLLTFHSLNSLGSSLPRGFYTPSVSSWTRHSLWSFITNLSLSTVPSLGSLRPGNAWHSRHTIGSWDAWETHYRSLNVKMICCLM